MNITVYLGAKEGNDPALKRAAQELGQWIGQSGNALVYGGSKTGLMGEIAKSVLDAGGTVTGVETTLFMQDDLQYDGLTELIVTETITERKTEMIRRGDAFIAFPGGTGTLEEIAEVMPMPTGTRPSAPARSAHNRDRCRYLLPGCPAVQKKRSVPDASRVLLLSA